MTRSIFSIIPQVRYPIVSSMVKFYYKNVRKNRRHHKEAVNLRENSKSPDLPFRVLQPLQRALLSVFGLVGLVFMILNNIISSKFFLVFSPIFIM